MTCLMAMMVMMKKPQSCFDELETKYKYKHMYKLKGVGEPAYHLGGNFSCDPDAHLHGEPKATSSVCLTTTSKSCLVLYQSCAHHH